MNTFKNEKELSEKRFFSPTQLWLLGVGLLVALYAIGTVIPPTSMYFQYPLQVIKCAKQPVIAYEFASSRSYVVPGSPAYKLDNWSHFYCTEQEALDKGYSKYPPVNN